MEQFIAAAEDWLATHTRISRPQRRAIAELARDLADDARSATPHVLAISGPPGTGKSTLARAAVAALGGEQVQSIMLSLDDYYLPASDRLKLSAREHPLFGIRGVPGTHDIGLLASHLRQLLDPAHAGISLPCFDKILDDRVSESREVDTGFVPRCIFLEGWIAGVPPQDQSTLVEPVNELEAELDPGGEWRRRVNACLRDYHDVLDPLLGGRWYLQAPDWESVVEWRWRQELENETRRFGTRAEVAGFMDHFQRLCMHMDATCGEWADRIVRLDRDHLPADRNR